MTHTDLLPCPFCGGEADMTEYSHQHAEGIGYMVECQSCSAMGEPFAVEGQMPDRHEYTKQRAVEAWNTRTPDTAPSQSADLIAEADAISDRLTTSLDATKAIRDLITALRAAEAENARLREALTWYGEQARLARLIHSEGDAGRHALSNDGGDRARRALGGEP